MKFRPWILGTLLLIGAGANLLMVLSERVAESEKQVRHKQAKEDPLLGIQYAKVERKSNLTAFGLAGNELQSALDRLGDLDEEGNRLLLASLLDQSGDQQRLDVAFCGSGKVRPRYAALAYLVKEQGGHRRPLSLRRVSGLEREEWSKTARIAEVYGELELGDTREEDATIMGLAAILLAREQDAIERSAHWGSGLRGRWSWEKLNKEHPGIAERVVEYLVLMHLTMEVSHDEGGFCRQ